MNVIFWSFISQPLIHSLYGENKSLTIKRDVTKNDLSKTDQTKKSLTGERDVTNSRLWKYCTSRSDDNGRWRSNFKKRVIRF